MSSLIEKKLREYTSDYLTYDDLCTLLPLTSNARYALIKRALKEGALIHLTKGVYYRGNYLQSKLPHPFELSHYLRWPSYISLESALSFHGLIPEAIYTTTSVTFLRKSTLENSFGIFSFYTLPKAHFFLGVSRESSADGTFFVASPWKAITDYIYCYRKNWNNMEPFFESLRLDSALLPKLTPHFAEQLNQYYQSRRIQQFLRRLLQS